MDKYKNDVIATPMIQEIEEKIQGILAIQNYTILSWISAYDSSSFIIIVYKGRTLYFFEVEWG